MRLLPRLALVFATLLPVPAQATSFTLNGEFGVPGGLAVTGTVEITAGVILGANISVAGVPGQFTELTQSNDAGLFLYFFELDNLSTDKNLGISFVVGPFGLDASYTGGSIFDGYYDTASQLHGDLFPVAVPLGPSLPLLPFGIGLFALLWSRKARRAG